MRHRFTRPALATCTIVLLAGGCSDITQPPAGRGALDPSFSHGGPSETTCTGLLTGTHDNVTVPPGAQCTLTGATVLGNVKALENSALLINNASNIRGHVDGDKADLVQIYEGTTVKGSVQIKEGGPAVLAPAGAFFCSGGGPPTPCEVLFLNVTIEGGNIQVEKMTGDLVVGFVTLGGALISKGNLKVEDNLIPAGSFLTIHENDVAENLQVFKNRGPGTAKSVTNNTVGENLQCFENDPVFAVGPNVAKQAQGQCAAGSP